MSLNSDQLLLKEQYQHDCFEQIARFDEAPEELKSVLESVWAHHELTSETEDNAEAKLSAASALIHLRSLCGDFEPEDIKTLVDLMIGRALSD